MACSPFRGRHPENKSQCAIVHPSFFIYFVPPLSLTTISSSSKQKYGSGNPTATFMGIKIQTAHYSFIEQKKPVTWQQSLFHPHLVDQQENLRRRDGKLWEEEEEGCAFSWPVSSMETGRFTFHGRRSNRGGSTQEVPPMS